MITQQFYGFYPVKNNKVNEVMKRSFKLKSFFIHFEMCDRSDTVTFSD